MRDKQEQQSAETSRDGLINRLESLFHFAHSAGLDVSFASHLWNPLGLTSSSIDAVLEKLGGRPGELSAVDIDRSGDAALDSHTCAFAVISVQHGSVLCVKNPAPDHASMVQNLCKVARDILEADSHAERQRLVQHLAVEMGRQVQNETLLNVRAAGKEQRNLEQMGNADLDVDIFANATNYLCRVLKAQGCAIFGLNEFRLSLSTPNHSRSHLSSAASGSESSRPNQTQVSSPIEYDSPVLPSPMPSNFSSSSLRRSRTFSSSGAQECLVASGGGKTLCSYVPSATPIRILGHAGTSNSHFQQLSGIQSRPVVAQYLAMTRSSGLNSKAYMESRSSDAIGMWALAPDKTQSYLCCAVAEADSQPAFLLYAYFSSTETVRFDRTEELFVEQVGAYLIYSSIRSRVVAVDRAQLRFTQRIQHELRTPLHAIIGVNEIAKQSLTNIAGTEDLGDLIDSISISADSLNVLVDDMVDFSLMERLGGERSLIDEKKAMSEWGTVCRVISSTCLRAFRLHQRIKSLEQTGSVKPPPPEMFVTISNLESVHWEDFKALVDLEVIRRIVWKLVTNAIQATEEGMIEISISLKAPVGRTPSSDKMDWLQIGVEDTGKGMGDQFVQERLFQPFGKEDEESDGVGLSLSICQLLAAQLSGRLMAESVVGKGTKFTLSLPLKKASKVAKRDFESTNGEGGQLPTIAFVDFDSPSKRLFVDRLLKQYGCQESFDLDTAPVVVIAVEDVGLELKCAEEVKALQERETPTDVVILPSVHLHELDDQKAEQLEQMHEQTGHHTRIFARPLSASNMREMGWIIKAANERAHSTQETHLSARRLPPHEAHQMALKIDEPRGGSTGSERSQQDHPFCVLVVEDNPLNARIMTTMLKRTGVPYIVATDEKEGVEAFEAHLPILVLLDINMPIINGFEACREMRKVLSPYKHRIIAITALSAEAEKRRGREAGMDDWFTKPTRMAPLMRDIKRWRREYEGHSASTNSTPSSLNP